MTLTKEAVMSGRGKTSLVCVHEKMGRDLQMMQKTLEDFCCKEKQINSYRSRRKRDQEGFFKLRGLTSCV